MKRAEVASKLKSAIAKPDPAKKAKSSDPALKTSLRGHQDVVTSVCFSYDNKHVVSSSNDGTVMVWNIKTSSRPYRFIGHKGAVLSTAIAPSGSLIASGSNDWTIRLWENSIDGQSKFLKSHSGPVRSVSFSSDG